MRFIIIHTDANGKSTAHGPFIFTGVGAAVAALTAAHPGEQIEVCETKTIAIVNERIAA